jgi:hypothetical protein
VVMGKAMSVPAFLDRVRQDRVATPGRLSDQLIRGARNQGRP